MITENALVVIPADQQISLGEGVETFITSLSNSLAPLKNDLANIVIVDDITSGQVANCLKGLGVGIRKFEAKKLETTEALRDEVKSINAFFKLLTDELDAVKKQGNATQLVYLAKKQKQLDEMAKLKAEEEAKRLKEQAEELASIAADDESYPDEGMREEAMRGAEAAEEAIEHIAIVEEKAAIGGGVGTSSLSYNYSAEVVDIKAIPNFILNRKNVFDAITKEICKEARGEKERFSVDGAKLVKTLKVGTR